MLLILCEQIDPAVSRSFVTRSEQLSGVSHDLPQQIKLARIVIVTI